MKTSTHMRPGRRSTRLIVGSVLRIGALALAVSIFATVPSWAAKYTMVIAHLYSEDLTVDEVAPSLARFKQLVESGTGGEIEVKIFGNAALGQEVPTGKEAQQGKTIQSVLTSSGATSSFYKDYQILATPFLFPNYKVAWEFFDSAFFANFMRGMLEQSGLRYLGTFDDGGGFVAFSNNKRLIKTLDDIKGLRIRTQEDPAHIAIMKALGASATPLPWGEVHTALATGLADGQFNAPGIHKAFKLYEVTDYSTWSGHVYNNVNWSVSEAWFSKLPKSHRKVIIGAAREAVAMGHGIATQMSVIGWIDSCKEFKACYILPDSEKAKMKAVTLPAFKKWITADFGVAVEKVEAVWAEVDRIAAELDSRWEEYYLK